MGGEVKSAHPISDAELFDQACPIYMSWGMSYEEFWHGDPSIAKYYRKAAELKQRQANDIAYLQGAYVYEAILCASPILNPFAKQGTKPYPYPAKPFEAKKDGVEDSADKESEARNARLLNLKAKLKGMCAKKG